MGWEIESITAKQRAKAAERFPDAAPAVLDHIAAVEAALYCIAYPLSELDIDPGPRRNAWMTSNMFPNRDDNDKVMTIEDTEPRVDYRNEPPVEMWHEIEFCSADSLNVQDGSKISDDFEILAVHQNAPGAYIGCGAIWMRDIRRAAKLLWPSASPRE